MQYRRLGNTDLNPSVLGFGCSMTASVTTRYPKADVMRTLHEAVEHGVTFFDTADVYGQGDSERLLGDCLRDTRNHTLVCTKAGLTVGPMSHLIRFIKPIANRIARRWSSASRFTADTRRRQERQCFDPAYLQQSIQGSLRRLRREQIDLFLLHNPPPALSYDTEVFELLERLQQAGTLRWFGVSCRTFEDALAWVTHPGIAALQVPLDRTALHAAQPLLTQATALGVGLIAREVLGSGSRTGEAIVQALEPILNQDSINVALVGMSCRRHLLENLRATELATQANRSHDS